DEQGLQPLDPRPRRADLRVILAELLQQFPFIELEVEQFFLQRGALAPRRPPRLGALEEIRGRQLPVWADPREHFQHLRVSAPRPAGVVPAAPRRPPPPPRPHPQGGPPRVDPQQAVFWQRLAVLALDQQRVVLPELPVGGLGGGEVLLDLVFGPPDEFQRLGT